MKFVELIDFLIAYDRKKGFSRTFMDLPSIARIRKIVTDGRNRFVAEFKNSPPDWYAENLKTFDQGSECKSSLSKDHELTEAGLFELCAIPRAVII